MAYSSRELEAQLSNLVEEKNQLFLNLEKEKANLQVIPYSDVPCGTNRFRTRRSATRSSPPSRLTSTSELATYRNPSYRNLRTGS